MPLALTPALVPAGLTTAYLRYHRVCPIGVAEDGRVRLLVAPDAQLSDAVGELATLYGSQPLLESASWATVSDAIDGLNVDPDLTALSAAADHVHADLRDLATQPPVVRYVNALIREAVEAGASDVHLESVPDGAVARLRIDGLLAGTAGPPPEHRHAVLSRLKLLAGLDIAEHRVPQDGRLRVRLQARELDIRVSTVPSMHGESIVLRLLEQVGRPTRLHELGLSDVTRNTLESLVCRTHGMLLVTGPTGSGKTTTLHAALHHRNLRLEKVITVEDPVEYQLQEVVQVPVNRSAGVSFADALRSLLRQDPDVIMVGELRDAESAAIGVQAAITGHLVLSTLHTSTALGAIPRLLDLGVAPYLIAASLSGVIAQRLVRASCTRCLVPYAPSPSLASRYGHALQHIGELRRGSGCSHCRGSGFRGRTGIFELLEVDEELRLQIALGDMRGISRARAPHPADGLLADALRLVSEGVTTLEEVHRVAAG